MEGGLIYLPSNGLLLGTPEEKSYPATSASASAVGDSL
jgi:hypothetical protein